MTDKILCPWCGTEMQMCIDVRGISEYQAWASCFNIKCSAEGPLVVRESEDEALDAAKAAALRRYTPPILCETCGEFGWDLPQCRNTDGTKYGRKECKYWSRKPTDEERSAAEWEK